ncbi:MAG: HAD-IA family hydrolase [Pseudonocardiaceae bacterium]
MIPSTANEKTLTCSGLLFDNDGVLIDASAAIEYCWRTFAEHYNLPADEVVAQVPGRRSQDVINRYAQMLPVTVDEALRHYEQLCVEDNTAVEALPGAIELLESIPRTCWTVVTSGTRDLTTTRLRAAGLPIPPVLVTAEDVSAGKPDPAPYRLAAERLGLPSESCLAIEDAPPGLTSARKAGCRTLALLTTHDATELTGADMYALNLSHVRTIFGTTSLQVVVSYSG